MKESIKNFAVGYKFINYPAYFETIEQAFFDAMDLLKDEPKEVVYIENIITNEVVYLTH